MKISKATTPTILNEFDTAVSLLDSAVSLSTDLNSLEVKLVEDISSEIITAKVNLERTNQVCMDTMKDVYLALIALASNHIDVQNFSGAVNIWKNCYSTAFSS